MKYTKVIDAISNAHALYLFEEHYARSRASNYRKSPCFASTTKINTVLEASSPTMALINDFERCCRLCAEDQEATILIFSAEAEAMLLQNKIKKYLLIDISQNDHLPKSICVTCCSKLQNTCVFIDAAQKAQEMLLKRHLNLEEISEQSKNIKIEPGFDFQEKQSNSIEVNVDPMTIIQNSEGAALSPNLEEKSNFYEFEDVTYLHTVDRENVSIKLIKTVDAAPLTNENSGDEIYVSKPFICNTCKRSYCTELALKNHSWIHNNEEKISPEYVCTTCNINFESKLKLRAHSKKHYKHGLCKLCGRVFRTEKTFALHLANHNSAKKKFICKICGRSYDTMSNLKNHSVAHSSERPFQCHFCKKGFKRNQDLKFHINQHTGAKPYKCAFCDKSFASSGNCYAHRTRMHPDMKIEAKEQRWAAVANENQSLKTKKTKTPNTTKTMKTTNVPKKNVKFLCYICNHGFMKRENYMYHMYKHTGNKPFKCTFCPEEFVTRKGLSLHHNIKHQNQQRPLGLVSKNALLN